MDLPLAYCTNLHPGEGLAELAAQIAPFVTGLRERLGWAQIGLDLRLGSRAIAEARADERLLLAFRRSLDACGAVVTSINAFPLSPFQAERVKERAYEPDWGDARRIADTLALLHIVPRLTDSPVVTISTAPGAFRDTWSSAHQPAVLAAAWGTWAGEAAQVARAGGPRCILCPEPEPWCTLPGLQSAAVFWQESIALFAVAAAAGRLGGDQQLASQAVANHLSLCLDTCHAAVRFEDGPACVRALAAAGCVPWKAQVSAAPSVDDVRSNPGAVQSLLAMAEPRFLHQTAVRDRAGQIHEVVDLDALPGLLARLEGRVAAVRSHFHIPLDREPAANGLGSTATEGLATLAALRALGGGRHISVETYTWSILGDNTKALEGTARELAWLSERLAVRPQPRS